MNQRRKKRLYITLLIPLTLLGTSLIVYVIFGTHLVDLMYEKKIPNSFGFLNYVIEAQDRYSLNFYYQKMRNLMFISVSGLIIFYFLIVLILSKIKFRDFIIIVIISFILIESVLRLTLFSNVFKIEKLRTPFFYADMFADDDYFKLQEKWGTHKYIPANPRSVVNDKDPLLGWSPKKSSDNPLGIVAKTPYIPQYSGKTMLFYGDSFVQGETPIQQKIPQILDRLLPNYKVYNYGVAGYGLDQIYLRFMKSHKHFENPLIVLGILTTDIDRCVLKYRGQQKPYFLIKDGELELNGVPVESDDEEWLKQNPIELKSYFISFLAQKIRSLRVIRETYKRKEKEEVAAKIIEAIVKEARTDGLDLMFVIFDTRNDWRKSFLIKRFKHWNVPYIDAMEFINQNKKETNLKKSSYYYDTGHPNELANQLIAEGILKHLKEEFKI